MAKALAEAKAEQVQMTEAQWFSHVTTWPCVVPIMKGGLKPSQCRSSTYDGFLINYTDLSGVWFVVRSELPTASCYPFKAEAESVNPMISIPADAMLNRFPCQSDDFMFYEVNTATNIKTVAIIPAGGYCGQEEVVPMNKWQNDRLQLATDEEVEYNGGRVLIHCQAGVSRSSTIAIAYVMVKLSMTMLEAFHFVKSKRPIVAPNFNFMGQLLDFESLLNRGEFEQDENCLQK